MNAEKEFGKSLGNFEDLTLQWSRWNSAYLIIGREEKEYGC
jgi:hypothetical protein